MPKKITTVHELIASKRFQKATGNRRYTQDEITELDLLLQYILSNDQLTNSGTYSILSALATHDVSDLVNRFVFLKKNGVSRSQATYVARYGKELGEQKWLEYCGKQRAKNTFEAKQTKYGWSREEFDQFNKSRAMTLDLCIQRHGEQKGREIWDQYVERQRYTNSLEYFQEKYGSELGESKWLEYNQEKAKSGTLDWIMEKYQVDHDGALEIASGRFPSSHISAAEMDFVQVLEQKLGREVKYSGKTKQFSIWNEYTNSICFYDIACTETMKIIEFHGDYWHCNPAKYAADYVHPHNGLTAKQIWERDQLKRQAALDRGFQVKVVWWSEFINNQQQTLEESVVWIQK